MCACVDVDGKVRDSSYAVSFRSDHRPRRLPPKTALCHVLHRQVGPALEPRNVVGLPCYVITYADGSAVAG